MSMKIKFKKYAFTLSEVLITITLIGFLATMTLATIGSSVQQRARLAEFRTAYSRMDIALKNTIETLGYIPSCYSKPSEQMIKDYGLVLNGNYPSNTGDDACNVFLAKFAKEMGAIRSCETNPINEGCIPSIYPTKTGFTNYEGVNAYVLENGMVIFATRGRGIGLFAVDINGRKGPNKWGLDIFPFSTVVTEISSVLKTPQGSFMVQNVSILQPTGTDEDVTPSGQVKSTAQMMKESAAFEL